MGGKRHPAGAARENLGRVQSVPRRMMRTRLSPPECVSSNDEGSAESRVRLVEGQSVSRRRMRARLSPECASSNDEGSDVGPPE